MQDSQLSGEPQGALRHDSGCYNGVEDFSPYEDLAPPQPPSAELTSLTEEELERLLRNLARIGAAVESHTKTLVDEVGPTLRSVLDNRSSSLPPAECLRLFEANRAARDSWHETSGEISQVFWSLNLPPFFERYFQEVDQATASIAASLGRAQLEDGPGWRKEVGDAFLQSICAANASEAEVRVALTWMVAEAKRELCEHRSVGSGLYI